MRIYRSKHGPFLERPYYTIEDIEHICLDELNKVSLLPKEPRSIRIERFIEKRFKIYPLYEDLPDGILGLIKFNENGVEEIGISKLLGEDVSLTSERRVKTTLAHEAGHGLLHAHLFILRGYPPSLFLDGMDLSESKILCRNDAIQGVPGFKKRKYDGRWWEHQANLAIGPLLLPRPLVKILLEPFIVKRGLLELEGLDQGSREEAERLVSEVFDVNPIVAKIRLDTIFPQGSSRQLEL